MNEYGKNWESLKKRCYERDNYICRHCGKKLKHPSAHHVIPLSRGGINALSNLITVCNKCHKKLDNQYLRVGTTQHVMNELKINDCMGDQMICITCDKCGRVMVTAPAGKFNDKPEPIFNIATKKYHLCSDCEKRLEEFIDEKVVK